jgi:hypothetical protein
VTVPRIDVVSSNLDKIHLLWVLNVEVLG